MKGKQQKQEKADKRKIKREADQQAAAEKTEVSAAPATPADPAAKLWGPWRCHDYKTGQNDHWCADNPVVAGVEYRFSKGDGTCGSCWCCKRTSQADAAGVPAAKQKVTFAVPSDGDKKAGAAAGPPDTPPANRTARTLRPGANDAADANATNATNATAADASWRRGVVASRGVAWRVKPPSGPLSAPLRLMTERQR